MFYLKTVSVEVKTMCGGCSAQNNAPPRRDVSRTRTRVPGGIKGADQPTLRQGGEPGGPSRITGPLEVGSGGGETVPECCDTSKC